MLVHKYNSWAPVSHWPHSSWIGCLYLSTPHRLVIDHKDLYSLGWGFMAIIGVSQWRIAASDQWQSICDSSSINPLSTFHGGFTILSCFLYLFVHSRSCYHKLSFCPLGTDSIRLLGHRSNSEAELRCELRNHPLSCRTSAGFPCIARVALDVTWV